jgi:DnaJ-class molecular chaperone
MQIVKVTTVILEQNPDSFLVTCASCNGKGRYRHDTSYRCKPCNGIGSVAVTTLKQY